MLARLSVFVPGLFGPVAGASPEALDSPSLEALERWWSLGRAFAFSEPAGSAPEQAFLTSFGIAFESELPGARLSLAAHGIEAPKTSLWRADPVHAHAGTVDVHIDDHSVQSLTAEESEALCRDFNRDFGERGWRLWATGPGQWFLQSARAVQTVTVPLSLARGRGLQGVMPSGPDGARLRALLNELQMWLFEHPLNQAREREGRATVNSVWPWGSGHPGAAQKAWQALWADDPFYRGAARLADCDLISTCPADGQSLVQALPSAGEAMLVLEPLLRPAAMGDIGGWYETLERLDREWFAPLLEALIHRRMTSIYLFGHAGQGFELRRSDLWRFWRRRHPLTRFMAGPDD